MTRALFLVLTFVGGCGRDLDVPLDAAWPMVGHDARHTSASPFAGATTPTVSFDFMSGDNGFVSDPVIDGAGLVYVAIGARNAAAQLYAIDPSKPTGLRRWAAAPCVFPDVRAAVAPDGTLVVTCTGLLDASEVVSLSRDGDVRWSVSSGLSDATAPVLGTDGTIYVGSAGVAAYSRDGARLWQVGQDDVPAPPALGTDGTLYFTDVSGQVHAVTSAGTEAWVTPVDSAVLSGGCGVTMGGDDDVFACFSNGVLAKLGTDGTVVWTHKLPDRFAWPAAIGADDTLYIVSIDVAGASSQATLHAFASDGTERWATLLDGTGGSAPALDAAGTIYVGDDQTLTAFGPDGGPRWSAPLSGSATSLAIARNGQLVVGASDGTVHAFGP